MSTYRIADGLPDDLPVFPLPGAMLLPFGQLPLNVFEDRYVAMVDHALGSHRMIGMIQPLETAPHGLCATGCVGRITSFDEAGDGTYEITLTGVCRFGIVEERAQHKGFRRVRPDYSPYLRDLIPPQSTRMDRNRLCCLLRDYFILHGLNCDWGLLRAASDDVLVTALAMVCPFAAHEKQALLEALDGQTRGDLFLSMIEMAILAKRNAGGMS